VRFGVLVHAMLAGIDLDADAEAIRAAAALQARLVAAIGAEQAAAEETVRRALAHPLLRRAARAARAGRCRREVALTLAVESGTLVEGVADLAFCDEPAAQWTVVDFKTDRDIAGRLPEYRWQLGAYAEAVARATGRPARAVLLHLG
jgi:ATP-dependent exoDNAse (exonuclease V) beta subunit